MAEKLSKQDIVILTTLAEYRVMTISQLGILYSGSARPLRGKLKKLAEQKLIEIQSGPYSGKKGRPTQIFSIARAGFNFLRSNKILSYNVSYDQVGEISAHSQPHMLAINDFRVQLVQVQKIVPDLIVEFLSPNSPFVPLVSQHECMTIVYEQFAFGAEDTKWVRYTPDGVFGMTCKKEAKTLLFYLEIDMGSESLSSARGYKGSIKEKIRNYQLTYLSERYKRYESVFKCTLQGFRLLFVTNSLTRMVQMSKLINESPPSEFICITDMESLSSKGLWSAIWYKGGRLDLPSVSILGSKAPKKTIAPTDIS
ncbi:MAG: replication-relaxation family protein [Sedimentisphaerales bacterium]|nr:replication-relaxation family protein [Sedimentisphaerales bacterium]